MRVWLRVCEPRVPAGLWGWRRASAARSKTGRYHVSESKHRLINGDACADLSRVITDTDGKGNAIGRRARRATWRSEEVGDHDRGLSGAHVSSLSRHLDIAVNHSTAS